MAERQNAERAAPPGRRLDTRTLGDAERVALRNIRAQTLSQLALLEDLLGLKRTVPSRRERRGQ